MQQGERARATADPPEGAPWDLPIGDAPLVFVDLEMTGLRAEVDRVLEVCAERVRGSVVEGSIETLVRPDPPAQGNEHVHGITAEALADAPTFAEIAERLEALFDGGILVAHAAAWDVAFLEAELARAGRPRRFAHYIDTLTLSRRALAMPSHSLGALCAELGIDRGRAHRAGDDVRSLRRVFEHVTRGLDPHTPRDLWHVRIGQRTARPDILAAAVLACDVGAPVMVRYRAARRPPEELSFCITSVRTDLDPPRVLGYLLDSRSRRELRADRILAIAPGPSRG